MVNEMDCGSCGDRHFPGPCHEEPQPSLGVSIRAPGGAPVLTITPVGQIVVERGLNMDEAAHLFIQSLKSQGYFILNRADLEEPGYEFT